MRNKPKYETFPEYIPNNKKYFWSHSVSQGGYVFILGTKERKPLLEGDIKNKLYEKLKEACINLNLIDVTIKIYPQFIIIFMVLRPTSKPQEIIDNLLSVTKIFLVEWDEQFLFSTIEDVGTQFVEDYCSKINYPAS